MGAVYVVVIGVVVVLVVAAVMFQRLGGERARRHEDVMTAPHTLRYTVPEGQDPAAALVALSRAGFEASADPADAHQLVIMCPLGDQQREEVRIVLERETANTLEGQERGVADPTPATEGRVRFGDE